MTLVVMSMHHIFSKFMYDFERGEEGRGCCVFNWFEIGIRVQTKSKIKMRYLTITTKHPRIICVRDIRINTN